METLANNNHLAVVWTASTKGICSRARCGKMRCAHRRNYYYFRHSIVKYALFLITSKAAIHYYTCRSAKKMTSVLSKPCASCLRSSCHLRRYIANIALLYLICVGENLFNTHSIHLFTWCVLRSKALLDSVDRHLIETGTRSQLFRLDPRNRLKTLKTDNGFQVTRVF